MASDNDKIFQKAKAIFLKHLKEVDTTEGPVDEVVLKFYLPAETESALDALVRNHGCTMSTRIISRAEQNAIDPRRKSCAQYTSVLVTPEAQATFLAQNGTGSKSPPKSRTVQRKSTGRSIKNTPKKAARAPSASQSSDSIDEDELVTMPRVLYESLLDQLVGIATELRKFRPTKRRFDDEDEEEEKLRSPKRARKSRV
ncbi:hypothetical protein B0H11DRAFT_2018056 [Mycena galericulata]|nr:hypothetical protein B0H11DRAFT_2018056 [Mycena galericulata]